MKSRVVCPIRILVMILIAALVPTLPTGAADGELPAPNGDLPVPTPRRVVKTEREWAKQLTHAQFFVTRMKATEPAFSGKYVHNHALGTYACVCCGATLFSSRAKFDSGTGWPSFWGPFSADRIQTAPDYHGSEPRVEVMCTRCDAHLGHVFNDGPPPTGLRFCINSVSLKFVPETKAKAKAKATAKAKPAPSPMPDPTSAPDASNPSTPAPSPDPDASNPPPPAPGTEASGSSKPAP